MSDLEFTKMEGLGNDFVVITGPQSLPAAQVVELCDRRFGVGADGVLLVTPGEIPRMDYWNADGSPAEMCGNGLRCVALYVRDRGWAQGPEFFVDTPVGRRRVSVTEDRIQVELGPVLLEGTERVDGESYVLVDVGNPHAVRLVEEVAAVDVPTVGPRVAREVGFDAGCNVEFATVTGNRINMRVWERGVGETLACGTGMAAVAAVALEGADGTMTVEVPGGVGEVALRAGVAWLSGPAHYVFSGVWLRDSDGAR